MATKYKLDKIFVQGVTYKLPADRYYVIKKIGTDATSPAYLKIDGVDTGPIISEIAPLHRTSSNLLGPLDLEELYYVVPPNKQFTVIGPTGAKIRAIGDIIKLATNEAIAANDAARFAEQGKKYKTYVTGTVSLPATWTNGTEYEILSLTPKTIETYLFNNFVGVSISGFTLAEGQVGIIFYLEGTPFDILTSEPGKKGIDAKSMPLPPADSTEEEEFSLGDYPIEVPGDHTFSIRAMNVSGADISVTSGSAKVTAIVRYAKSGK